MASLDSLKRRGLMVCVGTASGTIPPFDPQLLAMKGSLYLTRPALADYIADPAEKAELAGEVFGHVATGKIKIEINQRYPGRRSAGAPRPGSTQDHRLIHLCDLRGIAMRVEQISCNIGAELVGVNLSDAVHDDGLFAEIGPPC
jgi:hypothetical protein